MWSMSLKGPGWLLSPRGASCPGEGEACAQEPGGVGDGPRSLRRGGGSPCGQRSKSTEQLGELRGSHEGQAEEPKDMSAIVPFARRLDKQTSGGQPRVPSQNSGQGCEHLAEDAVTSRGH